MLQHHHSATQTHSCQLKEMRLHFQTCINRVTGVFQSANNVLCCTQVTRCKFRCRALHQFQLSLAMSNVVQKSSVFISYAHSLNAYSRNLHEQKSSITVICTGPSKLRLRRWPTRPKHMCKLIRGVGSRLGLWVEATKRQPRHAKTEAISLVTTH